MIRLFITILCTALALPAVSCDKNSLPIRYLKVIEAMDWHTMQSMLEPQAVYRDPTMTHFNRPAIDLTGPKAIVDFWRSASEESGTSNIRYDIQDCFETAGYTVFDYQIVVSASGAFWGINREVIEVPGRVMSVIRTSNSQVIEHIDYVDYAGSEAWINKLREELGAAN